MLFRPILYENKHILFCNWVWNFYFFLFFFVIWSDLVWFCVKYIAKVQWNTLIVARYAKKHQMCQNLTLYLKIARFQTPREKIFWGVCVCVSVFVCVPDYMSAYLFVYLSICPSVFVCLSICLSPACQSTCLPACLSDWNWMPEMEYHLISDISIRSVKNNNILRKSPALFSFRMSPLIVATIAEAL